MMMEGVVKREPYMVPANDVGDAQDLLTTVIATLHEQVNRMLSLEGTEDMEKDRRRIMCDISTDILIPHLKDAYIEAVSYLVYGVGHDIAARRCRSGRTTFRREERTYDSDDDEKEEEEELF